MLGICWFLRRVSTFPRRYIANYLGKECTQKEGIGFLLEKIVQCWWCCRSGKVAVDLRSLAKLVVAAAGNLSHVFLAVVFFSSLYWFIFFKQQTFVHTMLPSPDQAQKTCRQNQSYVGDNKNKNC